MKKLMISALLAFMGAPLAAAEPAAQAAVTSAMQCTPFEWAMIGEHQRAAILVPVTLNGQSHDFQLDTGADASFIPERVAVGAGLMKPGEGGARVADVRLGGAALGPRWFLTRGETGTIGLDMLVGFATIIDYPAQRICVTPTADLPIRSTGPLSGQTPFCATANCSCASPSAANRATVTSSIQAQASFRSASTWTSGRC